MKTLITIRKDAELFGDVDGPEGLLKIIEIDDKYQTDHENFFDRALNPPLLVDRDFDPDKPDEIIRHLEMSWTEKIRRREKNDLALEEMENNAPAFTSRQVVYLADENFQSYNRAVSCSLTSVRNFCIPLMTWAQIQPLELQLPFPEEATPAQRQKLNFLNLETQRCAAEQENMDWEKLRLQLDARLEEMRKKRLTEPL